MMESFGNNCKTSRLNAKRTQEDAAELLHIAPRTLASYEAGSPVPVDIAQRMVKLYQDPFLWYQYARTNAAAAEFLPEIVSVDPSKAALQIMCAGKNFELVQTKMMMLAADGKIDINEATEWDQVLQAAHYVVKAAFTLMFAKTE